MTGAAPPGGRIANQIRTLRFLNGELIYTLANRFNISEPTVYRLQAQALDHLQPGLF